VQFSAFREGERETKRDRERQRDRHTGREEERERDRREKDRTIGLRVMRWSMQTKELCPPLSPYVPVLDELAKGQVVSRKHSIAFFPV